MARPWSARCYGVARQREGSRQTSIGGSGVRSLRHSGLVLFIPWRVGAEQAGAAKLRSMASAGLRRAFTPAFRAGSLSTLSGTGSPSPPPDRNSWLRGLRRAFTPAFRAGSLYPLARGGRTSWRGEVEKYGFGGATACFHSGIPGWFSFDALRYGVTFPTTRSQQLAEGATACFHSGIPGWFSLSLGAWGPNKLARRS